MSSDGVRSVLYIFMLLAWRGTEEGGNAGEEGSGSVREVGIEGWEGGFPREVAGSARKRHKFHNNA